MRFTKGLFLSCLGRRYNPIVNGVFTALANGGTPGGAPGGPFFGEVTWNPDDKATDIVLSGGDLIVDKLTDAQWDSVRATVGRDSGKFYFEIEGTGVTSGEYWMPGIMPVTDLLDVSYPGSEDGYGYFSSGGTKYHLNVAAGYGAGFTANVIGCAVDLDSGKIWWSVSPGTWQGGGDPVAGTGEAYSGLSGEYFPALGINDKDMVMEGIFGTTGFKNTPPTGFDAWGFPTPTSGHTVFNPVACNNNLLIDYAANGFLSISGGGAGIWTLGRVFQGLSSGKWYWEYTIDSTAGTDYYFVGVSATDEDPHLSSNMYPGKVGGYGYVGVSGDKYHLGVNAAYGTTFTVGDVIGVMLDMDNGKIYFSKNGVIQNSGDPVAGTGFAYSGLTGTLYPAVGLHTAGEGVTANFGASAFTYTPPTGFVGVAL